MKNILILVAVLISLCCFFTISHAQEVIRYDGSAPIGKLLMSRVAPVFEKQEKIKLAVNYKTTAYGIRRLISRQCDIAGGGRPLENAEKTNGLVQTPICLDAYVFIVHASNPLTKIASEQIADIFKGKIKTWEELGVAGGKEVRIISPPSEAAYYVTAQKFIGFETLPENSVQAGMTTDVYHSVKADPLSIGLASYADIKDKKDIRILEILHQGKHAKITQTHIYFGSYPFRQNLYLFTNGEPEGNVKKFKEFFNTKTGRSLIMEAGFFLLPPE